MLSQFQGLSESMWVLSRYRNEKEAIVRDYLRWVFPHAFVSTLLDTALWDLAS